jgi:hypothetical protein
MKLELPSLNHNFVQNTHLRVISERVDGHTHPQLPSLHAQTKLAFTHVRSLGGALLEDKEVIFFARVLIFLILILLAHNRIITYESMMYGVFVGD